MPKSIVEQRVALVARPVPPGASGSTAAPSSVYSFIAVRLGRKDFVDVDFDTTTTDPLVTGLRAKIYVSPTDPWPLSLFKTLGSPKKVVIGEWIWWHPQCGMTLRLTQAESLGAGKARPYVLQVKKINSPF